MVDSTLTWTNHITSVVSKMGRAIGTVRRCCASVSRPLLRQIVQSLVLCHLDYCSTVWSSANSGELKKLQVAQNRAARLVLGCSMRTNVAVMHESLAWLTVQNRLNSNTLILFKSVLTNNVPVSIHSQIIFSSSVHDHNTRNARNGQLAIPRPRTNALKKSFIYRALALWNNLPSELHFIESRLTFKKSLKILLSN